MSFVLRWASVAVLLGLPGVSAAQPSGAVSDADKIAQISARAKAAFEAKRYAEAVSLYQEAYRYEPVATLLYNIAYIYDAHLNDRALARDYYRRYVNAPDAEAGARLKAFERIAVFDTDDARAAAAAAVPSAAPVTAPAPVVVSAPPAAIPPAAAPSAAASPAAVAPTVAGGAVGRVSARDDTWSTILLGVGGVALLTSGISAVLVAGTHDDFMAARSPSSRSDLATKGDRQALVADLSLAVGVSAVAAGLWLLLSDADGATAWRPAPVDGRPGIAFGQAF